jgi:hypothetical protein
MTWLMIGKIQNGEMVTLVNPQACQHERTVLIQTGHQYTIAGEATDDIEAYSQCLDCNAVKRGDGTWGVLQEEIKTDQIPY